MRITITNGYSWYNKGDAAIALGLFQSLRRRWPDCSLSFVSQTPEVDQERYAVPGLRVVGRDLERMKDSRRPKAARAVEMLAHMATHGRSADYGRAIREADLAVACGGGYLHDSWGRSARSHLAQMAIAHRAKVPLVLANQSIGPFRSERMQRSVGKVLRKAKAIVVRESITERLVHALGVPPSAIIRAPDLAFALADDGRTARLPLQLQGLPRPVVGVTVRRWDFPGLQDWEARFGRYVASVAGAVSKFNRRHGGTILFIPQVIFPGGDDDRTVANLVRDRLAPEAQRHAIIPQDDLHPLDIRHLVGHLDLMVATRMHSAIFALSTATPVFAIGYEHKTAGVFHDLGLDSWVTPIEDITEDRLAAGMEGLFADQAGMREHLRRVVGPLADQARKGLDAALDLAI